MKLDSGGLIGFKNIIMFFFYLESCVVYFLFDIFSGGYVYMDDNLII